MEKLILYFSLTLVLGGCFPGTVTDMPTPVDPIIKVINSTDWLMSILLIGSVLGLFTAFNGLKVGWTGVMACVGGMVLKAAISSAYVYWAAGLIFLGVVILAIVSIGLKNTALKELVIGIQHAKTNGNSEEINQELKNAQSKSTVALVNNLKAYLKTRGVI